LFCIIVIIRNFNYLIYLIGYCDIILQSLCEMTDHSFNQLTISEISL